MHKAFTTVYFDGNCPLCAREIAFLKKIVLRSTGSSRGTNAPSSVQFCDIHTLNNEHQPSPSTLLHKLHLRTADGQWLVGLDAMLTLWSHTYLRWILAPLFMALRIKALHSLASRNYDRWAEKRYQKLYCSRCAMKTANPNPPGTQSKPF